MEKDFSLTFSGMSCGSCERLIQRVAERHGSKVKAIDANTGLLSFTLEESKLDLFLQELAVKGFREKREGESRGNMSGVFTYVSKLLAGADEVKVESKLVTYSIGTATVLFVLFGLIYYYFLSGLPKANNYVPMILLSMLTAVSAWFSYFHVKCYKDNLSCANGMMVGMTTGMMIGFLTGAIIGATNGMFVGSVVGMAIGMLFGFKLGRHCGTMGAMEGIMAGLMAGTMGAMLSVMMLNDNLILFMYILFAVCSFSLAGLSYMMYREAGVADYKKLTVDFSSFVIACIVFTGFLVFMMFFGPKGPIVFS